MLLKDNLLRAIGRVAVLAGQLELDQYFLTGALIGPDPEVRDQLARPAENFGRLQDTALRLVKARYSAHQFRNEHRLLTEATTWMHDAKTVMDERNHIMHGTWGIGPTGEPGFLGKRPPHQNTTLSEHDLDALGDRMEAVSARSSLLIDSINTAVLTRTRYVLSLVDQTTHTEAPDS